MEEHISARRLHRKLSDQTESTRVRNVSLKRRLSLPKDAMLNKEEIIEICEPMLQEEPQIAITVAPTIEKVGCCRDTPCGPTDPSIYTVLGGMFIGMILIMSAGLLLSILTR